jgi:transposase
VLSLPPSIRVFVCTLPTDMRRSFDSLAAMAEGMLRQDPFSGHLFMFRNRNRDKIKVLWRDRGGYAIYYKRLEDGVFRLPESDDGSVELMSICASCRTHGTNPWAYIRDLLVRVSTEPASATP